MSRFVDIKFRVSTWRAVKELHLIASACCSSRALAAAKRHPFTTWHEVDGLLVSRSYRARRGKGGRRRG